MPDATLIGIIAGIVAFMTAVMRIIEILIKKISTNGSATNFTAFDKESLRDVRDWSKSVYDLHHEHYRVNFSSIIKTQKEMLERLEETQKSIKRFEKRELVIKCPLREQYDAENPC